MPFELDLPRRLKARGWKVKIFEKERLESPHVTIYLKRGDRAWRVGLRDGVFIVPRAAAGTTSIGTFASWWR